MVRYRTPQKKKTNWKGHLGTAAIGVVLIALGVFLLLNPPEEPEAAESPSAEAQTESAAPPGEEGDEGPGAPPGQDPRRRGPRPGSGAAADLGRSFFGLALIVLGVFLPVASVVIEVTSGKKWSRRAGKKHPFKKKL